MHQPAYLILCKDTIKMQHLAHPAPFHSFHSRRELNSIYSIMFGPNLWQILNNIEENMRKVRLSEDWGSSVWMDANWWSWLGKGWSWHWAGAGHRLITNHPFITREAGLGWEGERVGSKTSSCPSVVAGGQSSGIRLSYWDADAPSPFSFFYLGSLQWDAKRAESAEKPPGYA